MCCVALWFVPLWCIGLWFLGLWCVGVWFLGLWCGGGSGKGGGLWCVRHGFGVCNWMHLVNGTGTVQVNSNAKY